MRKLLALAVGAAVEVIVGNGGAPLSTGKNYGFAVVQQRPDATIQVDMLDWSKLGTDTS